MTSRDEQLNAVDDALRAAGIMGTSDALLAVLLGAVTAPRYDRAAAIAGLVILYPDLTRGEATKLVDVAREALA